MKTGRTVLITGAAGGMGAEFVRRFIYNGDTVVATDTSDDALDAVAFGVPFIANPDLVERLRRDAPFNKPDPTTFYGVGPEGYTDYPILADAEPS